MDTNARMRIIRRRDLIRSVRDRFYRQHQDTPDDYRFPFFPRRYTVGEIRANLSALDLETCTRDDVTAAMGTDGWTECACDVCGEDVGAIIQLGDEPDYESTTLNICWVCVKKVVGLFRDQINEGR